MSVTLMCNANEAGAVECKTYPGIFVREVFKGAVLGLRERNMYDDSDFFARVWNEETQAVEEVMYGTTRGWTYAAGADVDATPEVIAKARAFDDKVAAEKLAKMNALRAAVAGIDTLVTILRAAGRRKDLKGAEGRVTWIGPNKFKRGEYQARVELESGVREYFPLSSLAVAGKDITCEEAQEQLTKLMYA